MPKLFIVGDLTISCLYGIICLLKETRVTIRKH